MMILLALLAGCVHDVNLSVLQPADVTLPADIDAIAVLNRSRPKNFGQGVLDTIEGALTGEAIGMDREGSRAAVFGVVDVLRDSPRYDAIIPLVDQSRFPSDIFDRPLTRPQVREICRQNGCDALIALDAFDSDTVVSFDTHTETETDSQGREINMLVYDAYRETNVVSSWRLYHGKSGKVLDEVRDYRAGRSWSASGRTQRLAESALANPWDTARIVGTDSGRVYGARIAPTYVLISRTYYGSGDPRLKEARRYVRADDWVGAQRIWEGMVDDSDRKIRGKALYNLALAHEVNGQLFQARKLAKKAAVALSNGRSRGYVAKLDWRIQDQRRLDQQMSQEPAPQPRGTRPAQPSQGDAPLAVPADEPASAPRTRPQPRPPMERPR